jgi:hypothetical protein
MVDVEAESMVGGTIFLGMISTERVIQREISRVLVLNLSGKLSGACALPRIIMPLTPPFALIEDHPPQNRGDYR